MIFFGKYKPPDIEWLTSSPDRFSMEELKKNNVKCFNCHRWWHSSKQHAFCRKVYCNTFNAVHYEKWEVPDG